jgi:hypothetical protein
MTIYPILYGICAETNATRFSMAFVLKQMLWIGRIKELEEITLARDSADASAPEPDSSAVQVSAGSGGASADRPYHFVGLASELKITQDTHESLATDAANYLCSQLQHLLAPISAAVNQGGPWEETSAMVRLAQKLQKSKRNKRWRKRKRKHVAELFQKVELHSHVFMLISS